MLFFWKLHPTQEKTCCKCSQWWRIPRARSVSHTHHSEQGRSASFEQLLGSSHRRPLNKYGNIKTAQVSSAQKPLLMSDLHHPKWRISSWEFDSFTIVYSAKTTGILGTHVVIQNGAFLHELKTLGATMISITCAMASAWHKNEQQVEHVHSCVNRELSTRRYHNITESGKPTMSKMWTK